MKRAESRLIEQFLEAVKRDQIIGVVDTGGEIVLPQMVKALQAILAGTLADKALKIERKKGNPAKHENYISALIMRTYEKAGEKSTAAEADANVWRVANGYKALDGATLRKLLKQYRKDFERLESIALMIDTINQRLKKPG
jgi:hypothetical protein